MRVFVNMKQIGKRKNVIDKKSYKIADNIALVSDLREFASKISIRKRLLTICLNRISKIMQMSAR